MTLIGPDISHGSATRSTIMTTARWTLRPQPRWAPAGAAPAPTRINTSTADYIRPYWSMAQQYVLADHMFPDELGGSFTAHLDLIAGTTNLQTDLCRGRLPRAMPWGCDAPGGTRTSRSTARDSSRSAAARFRASRSSRRWPISLDAANVLVGVLRPASAARTSAVASGRSSTRSMRFATVRIGSAT